MGFELFQHWAIEGVLCSLFRNSKKGDVKQLRLGFQHNYKMINWVLNITWCHLSSWFINVSLVCVCHSFFPSVRKRGTSGDAFYWEELFAYNSVITGFVTSPRMVVLFGHDVTRGRWTKSTSASTARAAAFWKTRLCTQCLFVLCSARRHPLCPSLAPRPGHVTRIMG